MSNTRFRRTRRISDSKDAPKIRDLRKRRFSDADDDEEEVEEKVEINGTELTPEEVQGLLELLPYKEALIKIAKGEFEIEKVEEVDEDAEESAEDENFEEDEDLTNEGTEGTEGAEEGTDEGEEDFEDFEDYEDEDDTDTVEDSAHIDAWKKRLAGNDN